MRIIIFLSFVLLIQACGSKTVQDSKKPTQPVISVFDQGSTSTQEKIKEQKSTAPATQPPATVVQPPAADVKNSPKEIIKSYTAELQTVDVETKNQKGKKRDKQITEKVRKFFDFNGLAQLSLSSYWNKLTPKKQEEFSNLFTQLIEKSYLRRSKNLVAGNYNLSYGDEKINGNEATVKCNIYKDDVDLDIVYELHKVSDSWMIYNIIFDQLNLVKNYQSQFNKIIAQGNIDKLMDMMRKKLKENSSEVDSNL